MKTFQARLFILGGALLFGPVAHGQDLPGGDRPLKISGTVRDLSGAPVQGAVVTLHPGWQHSGQPEYAVGITDKNGRYELSLHYLDSTISEGAFDPENWLMARSLDRNLVAIQEFEGTPTNLDLNLQPGFTLSGSVKDTKGAPVSNALVKLSFGPGGASMRQLGPQPVMADAHGSFSIPALPQAWIYGFLNNGITAKGYGWVGGYFVTINNTQTNHYEFPAFVLKPADRDLAGQVLDSDSKPVPGANVLLNGYEQISARTITDAQGRFAFAAVTEGRATLTASVQRPEGSYISSGQVQAQGGDTNVVIKLGVLRSEVAPPRQNPTVLPPN
jgi:protocatechuate 3,4-dioxygenase beta subunit